MSHNWTRIALIGLDGPGVSRRVFLRGTLVGASALGTGALALPAAAQYGAAEERCPAGRRCLAPGRRRAALRRQDVQGRRTLSDPAERQSTVWAMRQFPGADQLQGGRRIDQPERLVPPLQTGRLT
jgi:hypothetical protein